MNEQNQLTAQAVQAMPTALSLPASAKPILDSLYRDGDSWASDGLPVVTQELKRAALVCKERVEQRLKPACPNWIKGAVAVLLTHHYVAALPEHVNAAIASDWVRVLARYPQYVIEQARIEWLDTYPDKKPKPGNISHLCRRIVAKEWALLNQCDKVLKAEISEAGPEADITPEQRSEIAAMVAQARKNLSA